MKLFTHAAERTGTPADLLVVGLGNPGTEYAGTRHNVGAAVVALLAERHGGRLKSGKERALSTEVRVGGKLIALAFPQTYMNLSGASVRLLVKRHGIDDPVKLVVVYDELDLPLGRVKLKMGGGAGGHNGLTDIIEKLGTKEFWRLRVGIGHPGDKDRVPDYVLEKARREEQEAIDPPFERSLDLLPRLATGRLQDAIAWLHTSPEDEAKRKAALEARALQKEAKEPKE